MTPEGKIKAKVNRQIKKLGPKIWRFMPVQMGMGIPGLDYFFCANGTFVGCETKARKGARLTDRQQQTADAIRAAGGLVFVVYDDESLDFMMGHLIKLCQ